MISHSAVAEGSSNSVEYFLVGPISGLRFRFVCAAPWRVAVATCEARPTPARSGGPERPTNVFRSTAPGRTTALSLAAKGRDRQAERRCHCGGQRLRRAWLDRSLTRGSTDRCPLCRRLPELCSAPFTDRTTRRAGPPTKESARTPLDPRLDTTTTTSRRF